MTSISAMTRTRPTPSSRTTPTVSEVNGYWRAMIGRYRTRAGKIADKPHYFGRVDAVERAEAERQARAFRAFWEGMRVASRVLWTEQDLKAAARLANADATDPAAAADSARRFTIAAGQRRFLDSLGDGLTLDDQAQAIVDLMEFPGRWRSQYALCPTGAPRTLHEVLRRHCDALDKRPGVDKRTASTRRSEVEGSIIPFLRDRAILDLDRAEAVDTLIADLSIRRVSVRAGRPLSADTVVEHRLKPVRQALEWAEDSGYWPNAPKKWERKFRAVKRATLLTDDEKAARDIEDGEADETGLTVDAFTTAELATLWAAANPWQRFLLGGGLCHAATQTELSHLRRGVLHATDDGGLIIRRSRHKTGVRGIHYIPEPVAALFRKAEQARPDSRKLVHVYETAKGQRLVWWDSKGNRRDAVGQLWSRLLARCPQVRPLPFKYLRKTSATLIAEHTESELYGEMHLMQAPRTLAGRRYIKRTPQMWARLERAQREVWNEVHAGMFRGEDVIPPPAGFRIRKGGRRKKQA